MVTWCHLVQSGPRSRRIYFGFRQYGESVQAAGQNFSMNARSKFVLKLRIKRAWSHAFAGERDDNGGSDSEGYNGLIDAPMVGSGRFSEERLIEDGFVDRGRRLPRRCHLLA